MDYEKKYKEALERAKEELGSGSFDRGTVEYIFPELKESEYERIRKVLIELVKCNERSGYFLLNNVSTGSMIAWLEKQREIDKTSYEIAEKEKREFVGDGFIKCYADFQDFKEGETYWLEYVDNDNYNVRSDNLLGKMYHITPCQLYTIFKKQTWLEKQGEKSIDVLDEEEREFADNIDSFRKEIDDSYQKGYNEGVRVTLEKQGEQSIQNVPSRETILNIWDLGNEWKELTNSIISTEYGTQLKYIQNHWQESEYYLRAKQGKQKYADKVEPKFHKGDWIVFNGLTLYVKEVVNGFYRTISKGGIPNSYDWDIDNVARLWTIQDAKDGDVLAEDSCIFIIQKMLDNTTAKTYCTLYNDGDFDDGSILYFDVDSTKPATKEQRDLLFQKMKEAGYEWDAEKKKKLKKISQCMISAEAKEALYDKTAWSEEDERNLKGIIDEIEANKNNAPDYDLATYDRFLSWLKSLRPQNRWKPSSEQMEALEHFVRSIEESGYASPYDNNTKLLNSLFFDLKKLNEE